MCYLIFLMICQFGDLTFLKIINEWTPPPTYLPQLFFNKKIRWRGQFCSSYLYLRRGALILKEIYFYPPFPNSSSKSSWKQHVKSQCPNSLFLAEFLLLFLKVERSPPPPPFFMNLLPTDLSLTYRS